MKYLALITSGSSSWSAKASCGILYLAKSGNQSSSFDFPSLIFSASKSCLFKNNITDIVFSHLKNDQEKRSQLTHELKKTKQIWTYLLVQIPLKRSRLSLSLFVVGSSRKTILYEEHAVTKMMAVTSLKHWIHFRRSSRWPPTSNMWKLTLSTWNRVSMIPDVSTRHRRMSCSLGE